MKANPAKLTCTHFGSKQIFVRPDNTHEFYTTQTKLSLPHSLPKYIFSKSHTRRMSWSEPKKKRSRTLERGERPHCFSPLQPLTPLSPRMGAESRMLQ